MRVLYTALYTPAAVPMPSHRSLIYATTASGAFSLTALWELLAHVNWMSVVAFAGSVASTAVAWWISHRAELTRAAIDREHAQRQAKRDEDLADLLTRLKIHQAEADADAVKAKDSNIANQLAVVAAQGRGAGP